MANINVIAVPECTVTDISDRKVHERTAVSNYTSKGIIKPRPCDPIRTKEDIDKFSEYLHNSNLRNWCIFNLGISIGLRASDILSLRCRDVCDSNGTIYDEIIVNEKKTRKMNHPMLSPYAKEVLSEYMSTIDFEPDDCLFFGRSGKDKPITVNMLYRILSDAGRALALPYHIGTHTLRKTFAYWTIKLHDDSPQIIYSLMEMLNHSDLKATLHYSGQSKDEHAKMYNDIGDLMTGKIDTTSTNTDESKLDKILAILQEELD